MLRHREGRSILISFPYSDFRAYDYTALSTKDCHLQAY